MGGGTHRNTSQTTYVRYAAYIEAHHQDFLAVIQSRRDAILLHSPFTAYTDIKVEDAFFGAGYAISSFPALYDMYGKFMAGLDIEALYDQIFEGTVNSPTVASIVAAESSMMDDDIEANSIPRMKTGMRDINSVMSSSFVIGRSLIEDAKAKSLSRFSAGLKYSLIPIVTQRWATHLEWNKAVVGVYAEVMKFYYSAKTDIDEANYSMAAKDKLWPFTVLDFQRAALGALQGATTTKTDVAGASTASKVISGALSGAAMGAMVGGVISPATPAVVSTTGEVTKAAASGGAGWGAGIGAVLGIAAALTY